MTESGAPQNTDSIHRSAAAPGKTDRILPADAPVRPKPKLLDQLIEALRSRHYSRRTERTYCHWVKRFIVTMLPESLKRPLQDQTLPESEDKHYSMNKPLDQETYLSTRKSYDEAELEVSGRYDKWILTLSGGALGLSITFIEKIAKSPTPDTLVWLKISWVCLVLSLLTGLLSLVTSQSAIRENRNELDLAHSERRAPRLIFSRCFTYVTNGLNWGSLFLFILGVAFLCVFSFTNIDQSITKGGKSHGRETTATTSNATAEGKDRVWLRSTTTSSSTERGTGIRSAAPAPSASTSKGK